MKAGVSSLWMTLVQKTCDVTEEVVGVDCSSFFRLFVFTAARCDRLLIALKVGREGGCVCRELVGVEYSSSSSSPLLLVRGRGPYLLLSSRVSKLREVGLNGRGSWDIVGSTWTTTLRFKSNSMEGSSDGREGEGGLDADIFRGPGGQRRGGRVEGKLLCRGLL